MPQAQLPLEMLASITSHPFQLGFARQALRMLRASEHVSFEATAKGLLMCASSEEALMEPLGLLRDSYGPDMALSPPRVRYVSMGERNYEPIMRLRVSVERHLADAVREDLVRRKAVIQGDQVHDGTCFLRAEAPLRALLGYADALARLTDGTGRHWIWLNRYVPIDGPPGGHAA